LEPATIEAALEHGYLRGDSAAVAAGTKRLGDALLQEPGRAELVYLNGFAHFAAARALNPKRDGKAMIAELERAVEILATVRGEPWESEAMGLQGAVYGQLIGLKGGMAGMTLGAKSGRLTTEAMRRLPASPRTRLFRAEIVDNTPAMFGGDHAAAAKLYQEAVDLFAAGEKAPGPRWGRVEALTWLGISCHTLQDIAGARSAWEQALALEPADRWVKFALLPSLPQKTSP
jgi:tetratricopeptide (TPR) repeat protein